LKKLELPLPSLSLSMMPLMRVKTVPSKPQDGAVDAAQQVEVQSG
jgi:hypothetical protein